MEIFIILSLSCALLCLKKFVKKMSLKKRRQEKEKYLLQRQEFYAKERQKVIAHYMAKLSANTISQEAALKDVLHLLAFNSGGGKEWLQEFRNFKKKTKKSAL